MRYPTTPQGQEKPKEGKQEGKKWREMSRNGEGKLVLLEVIDFGMRKSTRKRKVESPKPRRKFVETLTSKEKFMLTGRKENSSKKMLSLNKENVDMTIFDNEPSVRKEIGIIEEKIMKSQTQKVMKICPQKQSEKKERPARKEKEKEDMTGPSKKNIHPRKISTPRAKKSTLKDRENSSRKDPGLGISPAGKLKKKTFTKDGNFGSGKVGRIKLLFEELLQPNSQVRLSNSFANPLHVQQIESKFVTANGMLEVGPILDTEQESVDRIGQAKKVGQKHLGLDKMR